MRVERNVLVAVDARGYFTGGGIGRYTRNLVRELVSARPAHMTLRLLISNRHTPEDLALVSDEGVDIVVSRAEWMNAEEEDRWLSEEVADATLFHSLSGHWVPMRPASVLTLHDLTPIVRPDLFPADVMRFRYAIKRALARASRVLAVSTATANDARRVFMRSLPPTTVVSEAADEIFTPSEADPALLARLGVARDEFFLCVSVLNPHKNLVALIEAYAQSDVQTPFVIVGAHREAHDTIEQAIAHHGLEGRVRLVGRVTDSELAQLYSSCRAFVYPSLYEGFGLPVIEAMACGAAVIASQTSSVPEVAGGAAFLVDPTDVTSLADALQTVDADGVLREALRRRGLARAAEFSWSRTAELTLAAYSNLLPARAA
jgi:glycosyltransferase involved in cell wall biosynthesis